MRVLVVVFTAGRPLLPSMGLGAEEDEAIPGFANKDMFLLGFEVSKESFLLRMFHKVVGKGTVSVVALVNEAVKAVVRSRLCSVTCCPLAGLTLLRPCKMSVGR